MAEDKELTPLMKQYWGVKNAHPDKIILFRMGDFFEMFNEDALIAAPILGIALTVRNKKSGDQTPMCGVPHHAIGGQINKLLEAGHKVAICDQVEDPKLAKGLVRREVTRILSPGMVYDPDTLDAHTPNYLCAWDERSLSFMDSTTGECFYFNLQSQLQKKNYIENLSPVEVVFSDQQSGEWEVLRSEGFRGVTSVHNDLLESPESLPSSAQRLLSYGLMMQGEALLASLKPFEKRESEQRMNLSQKVIRHLEVFATYKGDKVGSLYHTLDRTQTAGGGRRLRQWLLFPLTDRQKIADRHNQVEFWSNDLGLLKAVRKQLFRVGDLERRLGRLALPNFHPRDLKHLGESVEAALALAPYLSHRLQDGDQHLLSLKALQEEVARALVEEVPQNYREITFIQLGYRQDLDELIELSTDSQKKVRDLEENERERTGIQSLKVRYNNVFGYYIEITNTHKNKVPTDRYQRKQTLANAERFVTDELVELEKKVITAKTRRAELEIEVFQDLKKRVMEMLSPLLLLADEINHLDTITSLAWLALEANYVRPQLHEGAAIELQGSRHPVIEQFLKTPFVSNDIYIAPEQCVLLTGPNMAGKSTLMRQVAITVLLAQMGSFVPARQASLPLIDQLFTRIGASDFLTEGLSTFMVEMQETAEMLKCATPRTLVILDEVGRGTSTYDGLSLAQSILEYFLRKLKSYTLFATHYHELTRLENRYPGHLVNKHMSIVEQKGHIQFRYHLAEGPAQKSYGLQVAKLAGLPPEVIQYASQLLARLENTGSSHSQTQQMDLWETTVGSIEPIVVEPTSNPWLERIKDLEIQKLTPLDALNKLAQWQQELS